MAPPATAKMNRGFLKSPYVRRFVAGFAVVAVAAAATWPLLPRRYEATASVIMRPTNENGQLDRSESLRQPLDENAIQSEMDLMASPAIASVVIAQNHLATDPEFGSGPTSWRAHLSDWAHETLPSLLGSPKKAPTISTADLRYRLQKRLSISRDRRSYTIKFGYWSSDPTKAVAMTESLLRAYLDDQEARKRKLAESFSDSLSKRVADLRARQERSERAVSDFTVESDLVDSATRTSLENQLTALSKEAADARERYINATMQAELQRSRTIGGALEILAPSFEADSKDAALPDTSRPVTWLLDNKLGFGSPVQIMNMDATAKAWAAREEVLRKAMKAIREELAERHRAELKLDELRQDAATDKSVLDAALVRLKEQSARLASLGPDVEILAHAEIPARPTFPDPVLAFLGTLLAGIAAGAAMVWRPLSVKARQLLAAH
ncbi:hypothetical protein [Microvirga terricola]|uniref:Chain length determinant protein n=1 Tax=Microvirga terricola TaxID=2719797 RepID=A0ABX0V936_9HYPH|nr:hypothetical protein [Microvirga terricola]NIX76192.1 hypothetical protein [Microvirga terricola]